MFKRIARTTRISTAILMVVSILMPTTVADAAGTITKQITVLGIDGQPYVGASVSLKYPSATGSLDQNTFLTPVTTNSSGVASLTFPDTQGSSNLVVMPALGDTTTGAFMDFTSDGSNSTSVTVTLQRALAVASILASDGTPVGAGAGLAIGNEYRFLTRGGVFGIALDSTVQAGTCHWTQAMGPDDATNSFPRTYGAKIFGTGNARELKIYDDIDVCSQETRKVNGIYQLQLYAGNVSGYVRDGSGAALTFSAGEGYRIQPNVVRPSGNNPANYSSGSFTTSNGLWSAYIDTATVGKYELTFSGYGNSNYPLFAEKYLWVTSDNKLSWNQDGSSPATTLTRDFNIPQANFTIKHVETGTTTVIPKPYLIERKIAGTENFYSIGALVNVSGPSYAHLTNGTYKFMMLATDGQPPAFQVSVADSVITLLSSSMPAGYGLVRDGNNFSINKLAPNATVKFVGSSGQAVPGYIRACTAMKVCVNKESNSSGIASFAINDGTYPYVFIEPTESNEYVRIQTSATVSGGILTLATGTQESDGSWTVQFPTANLRLMVMNPLNNQPLFETNWGPLGFININTADQNWNPTNSVGSLQINRLGGAAARLTDGRYIMDLNIEQSSDLILTNGLAARRFRITVASGVATVTSEGVTITAANSVFTITPHIANLEILVKDESGTVITSGNVSLTDIAVNGSQSNTRMIKINPNGRAYFYFNNPTGKIIVSPSVLYPNLAAKSYAVTYANDSVTVTSGTKVGNSWVLNPSTPNVRLFISYPESSTALDYGWIDVDQADDSWNSTGYIENLPIWPELLGQARTSLGNGKYLFYVNVEESPENAGLATQTYRVTVADSGVTIALGNSNITPVAGKFQLSPTSSNFEILIKKADGTIFTNGWVEFCSLVDNKENGCRGQWISRDGNVSKYLSNGSWRVFVQPNGNQSDVVRKAYDVVVANGVPTVTGASALNGVWTLYTGTPNLSGTFSVETGTLTFGQNQNIGVQLQKFVNGRWDYVGIGSWTNTNSWAMSATGTAGQYRLLASPWNFSDLVQSTSAPFWINSSGQFATTETGTYLDSMTAVNIILRAPNLKLKVVNPLAQPGEANYLAPGGWVSIEKITGQTRTWVTNADIRAENPGLTGVNITENGTYNLRVNPPSGSNSLVGVAAKNYLMTVNGSDSITVTSGGVAVAKDGDRFVLQLATANVSARILRTDGTPAVQGNGRWVGVNLQKLNSWGDWDWIGGTNTDDNGYVSFRVDAAGKYRLRIEPYGDSLASVTFSTEFTVAANEIDTLNKQFGSITLAGPSIRISAASSAAPSVTLADTSIEIRKDGRWVDWANTGQGKIAGISFLSEGTYEITLNPSQDQIATSAKKSYKVIATKNSDGVIVGQVPAGDGVSVANGITTLLLGVPTLVGYVKDPNGTVVQPNAQVYAVDLNSGGEKWEFNATTNYLGRWSMILPAGRYKIYARAPWGTAEYGTSNGIGEVVVAENGSVTTPNGYPANAFNINLKAPTWSGVVKAPTGDTVIPQARICLLLSNNWNCTNADSVGRFALSMPETFNSFTGTNPILEVADDAGRAYPMNRVQGASNVSQALGGTQNNSVVLRLKSPNTEITVTPSEGTLVASNLWVVAERDGVGYLGGGSTNNEGVVKLNIDSPHLPFKVKVDVNGNPEIAANFAPATKEWTSSQIASATTDSGTVNAVFHGAVTLSPPNFRFIVREPTTNADPVGNTWVELLGGNDGPWVGSTSVDYNGFGSFKLDVPSTGANNYVMIVHPSWGATTNFTKQAYGVTVAPNGNITVIHKTSITEVRTQVASGKTVFPLALGVPSVTGIVVDPDSNTVANSYVTPFDASNNQGLWQQGVSTRNSGQFAINLADGLYKLEASVPWDMSGVAKSAQCEVRIETRTVTTGGSCIQNGTPNTVRLQLRAPNVKFTLKVGNTVIPYANVGVGAGKWWTNAQSNSEGVVSLFIDAVAIRELNNWSTSQKLWLWIDPPYGSSTMARWSCSSLDNKPLCKDLADVPANGDYVGKTSDNGAAWVVQGVTPNTRLKIVDPTSGDDLPNAWVSVLATNNNGNQWWLGGGNSGSDGYVGMNLETATAFSYGYNKLMVEVQAPWNQRTTLATNLYTNGTTGYTYESLTAVTNFSPATPNLKLIVRDSNNYINRYGWVGVEEVNSSNEAIKWVGGYSLNEYGLGSIFLAANKRFRITSYPGPGRAGAATPCIVETNQSTPPVVATDSADCGGRSVANGELTIRLNGGNVVGTVTRADGTPVVGAAVYANLPGAATEVSAVITVTDETGHYDLQLTANQQWNLKVFPVPSATDNLQIKTHSSAITAPSSGANTINFTLDAVVG